MGYPRPVPANHRAINSTSEKVIGCAFAVHNSLGRGYLEKVYENALAHELVKQGMTVRQQDRLCVRYDGIVVGDFQVDLIVDNLVLVEIKAVSEITRAHEAQLLNYLMASGIKAGLLLNFARPSVQINRKVLGF